MESACWGIKFKPIIKKVHTDDSKYYLEIVPEVSCLKNFDKIEWKHENSFYEYVIPMTYKVIVRRRDPATSIEDATDSLNAMYHSCVDLLHPSITNTVLASGDINRIVSDTFIVSKVTTDINKCNVVSKLDEVSSTCNVRDTITQSMQTFEEREDFTLKYKNGKTCTATKSTVLAERGSQDIIHADAQVNPSDELTDAAKNLVEKGTYTSQHMFPVSIGLSDIILDNNLSYNLETIQEIQEILPEKCPDEFMQKLSLSPICSLIVNTECALATPPYVNTRDAIVSSIVCHDDQIDRGIAPYMNISFMNDNVYNVITNGRRCDDLQCRSTLLDLDSFNRITPEKRIEQFLNLLRKEILPLKSMLDDIVMRYTALNIGRNDFVKTNVCKNQPKIFKMLEDKEIVEEQSKHVQSNRVVYTIVFDG